MKRRRHLRLMRHLAPTVLALIITCPASGFADPNCRGQVISDIQSVYRAKRGQVIEYLNLGNINDDGTAEEYGVHGGGFYPAKSIRLLNCHLAKTRAQAGNGFNYDLVLDNTSANSSEIIRFGVEGQLVAAGLDNADAGNAADAYMSHPESACGRAAKMILGGNMEMVSVVEGGNLCQPR